MKGGTSSASEVKVRISHQTREEAKLIAEKCVWSPPLVTMGRARKRVRAEVAVRDPGGSSAKLRAAVSCYMAISCHRLVQ